ncbi:MAG: TIGR00282 family metallophosphoesterase [bacterium]|nr:TIGR00282 family metallophosphoesterase [bacterium]
MPTASFSNIPAPSEYFRLMFVGDIVARPGRRVIADWLPKARHYYNPEVVIANGENAAGGFGLDVRTAEEIFRSSVDVITLGNHVWDRKEIFSLLEREKARLVRPANYPPDNPGTGMTIWTGHSGFRLGVMNLIGRVFIPGALDCPFLAADRLIEEHSPHYDALFVDMHAEATSEKKALAWHLAGRAAAVIGTHTHTQTADEVIIEGKTAYLSDVGMTGPHEGIIGFAQEEVVERFITGRNSRLEPAKGRTQINAVVVDICRESGEARGIYRINEVTK